jgi:hypothetical protein
MSFLAMSLLCSFELGILTTALWNKRSKIYFWSIAIATFSALAYTLGVLLYLFAPYNIPTKWLSVLLSCIGYWIYTPAEFMVMYTR